MKIGKKLKSVRLQKNESIKIIAQVLNMSEGNYCKIERDEIEISRENTEKLAKHYNLKVDELINGDNLTVHVVNNDGGKLWSGINQSFNEDKSVSEKLIDSYTKRIDFLEKELVEKNKIIDVLINKLN